MIIAEIDGLRHQFALLLKGTFKISFEADSWLLASNFYLNQICWLTQVYLKRSATARAWSRSPSLSARVITVSLRLARASRERC